LIRGFATPHATRAWSHRHRTVSFTLLGRSGLTCSRAGFGGYRVSRENAVHRKALHLALEHGINLIDTSANYTDGDSERLVGEVLAARIAAGSLTREAVVVVTKAGYLQGQNLALSRKRQQEGHPFPERVAYAEGLEHCIHPDFLENQITRSLERLGLGCIDVMLLHNPEYYLNWSANQGIEPLAARNIYDDRIRRAFDHLEKEAHRGRIRFYGISSNTFPESAMRADFTSLSRIHDLARDLKADHRLAVVQFPMNLFENGAVLETNQPNGRSLLDAAHAYDLGTLVNRPLNAFTDGRLMRLADVPDLPLLAPETIIARLETLAESETQLSRTILPPLDLVDGIGSQIRRQLAMAESLKAHYDRYESYTNWLQILNDHILPRANGVLAYLDQKGGSDAVVSWSVDYRKHLEAVLSAITAYYAQDAAAQVEKLKAAVQQTDRDWNVDGPLSQMAIRALLTTPGVSAVLVGMRRPSYVQDTLAALIPEMDVNDRTTSWMKLRARLDAGK
jgi:aryl-alcohol dehydrogenase-like predicted oxidoreductase